MKPFFCIDVTENKENETINGLEFITQTSSKESLDDLNEKQDVANDLIRKSQYPLPVRIIKSVCGFAALILGFAICASSIKIGIATAYKNAPFLSWIVGVCFIVWLILFILSIKKSKKVLDTDEAKNVADEINEKIEDMYDELNIPTDADNVDILIFQYVNKNGEVVLKGNALSMNLYLNTDMKVFVSNDCLCLADLESVYSIPLNELKRITTIPKKIMMPFWNKEEPFNKGRYKEYNIKKNQYESFFVKPYYILEIEHNDETWGIYFPPYELPIIEKLTNLKADA